MARAATIPHEVVDLVLSRDMTATRAWREYLKLTPDDVASKLAITSEAYALLEQIESADQASLDNIAAALGITVEQLDF